jgi:hypothetical protein
MYTIRLLCDRQKVQEVVVSDIDFWSSFFEDSKSVVKFQVWQSGIGMVSQELFGCAEYLKWINTPFFENALT